MQFWHPCILGTANHVRRWQHEWSCSMGDKFHCGSPQNPFSRAPFPSSSAGTCHEAHAYACNAKKIQFGHFLEMPCFRKSRETTRLFRTEKKQSPTQPLRLLRHQIYWGEGVSMPAVWNRRDKVYWTEPRVQMRETVRLWNKEGGNTRWIFFLLVVYVYISIFQY